LNKRWRRIDVSKTLKAGRGGGGREGGLVYKEGVLIVLAGGAGDILSK